MAAVGRGGEADLRASDQASAKGCSRGEAHACLVHGILSRDGLGTDRSEVTAREDFDRGCKQHDAQACAALTDLGRASDGASVSPIDRLRLRDLDLGCPGPGELMLQ